MKIKDNKLESQLDAELRDIDIATVFFEETHTKSYPRSSRKPNLDEYDGNGE